jgi:hypothetical protein
MNNVPLTNQQMPICGSSFGLWGFLSKWSPLLPQVRLASNLEQNNQSRTDNPGTHPQKEKQITGIGE